MIANTTNEATASMNIWLGQKRPGLSFGSSSTGGPARAVVAEDRTSARRPAATRIAGVSQTCRPKNLLIVSVPMLGAALEQVLDERAGDRRRAGDVDRDLRGEERVEVPRQQVAGQAEHERAR